MAVGDAAGDRRVHDVDVDDDVVDGVRNAVEEDEAVSEAEG